MSLQGIKEGTIRVLQPPHWLAEVAAVVSRLAPEQASEADDGFAHHAASQQVSPTAPVVPLFETSSLAIKYFSLKPSSE